MAPDGLLKTCACKKDWHVGERGEVCFSALDLVCVLKESLGLPARNARVGAGNPGEGQSLGLEG